MQDKRHLNASVNIVLLIAAMQVNLKPLNYSNLLRALHEVPWLDKQVTPVKYAMLSLIYGSEC